jgi:hypothetical protein
MSWITDLLLQGAAWIKPYTSQMAVAFVATLLVIYGDAINRTVRVFVKPYPFLLRISAFVLLCTLGYGALTVWGSAQVKQLLLMIPDVYLPLVMLGAFILLGILAERYHKSG